MVLYPNKLPESERVCSGICSQASKSEHPLLLSAAEIFECMKKQNPTAMLGTTANRIGSFLNNLGIERVHTRYGNRYKVMAWE